MKNHENHENPWKSMKNHDKSWTIMKNHEKSWKNMKIKKKHEKRYPRREAPMLMIYNDYDNPH